MAAPTLTLLNSTVLETGGTWTLLTTADTDLKKEGASSQSGILRADAAEGYCTVAAAPVTAANKTFRGWINTTNIPYMEIFANGGYELGIWDGSVSAYKTMFGSDTYFGGWFYIVWDMNAYTTLTLANVRRWGVRAQHTGNAKQAINSWMDGLRYLDGYSMTGGSSGDKVKLTNIEVADRGTTTLYGYGVLQVSEGVYFCYGKMQFGTGATTHYFEMDGQVLVFGDKPVAAGLYSLAGIGSGTNIVIKNSVIRSAGTTDATRFSIDFSEANLAALEFSSNLVVRASTSLFKSGQTVTGNTFDNCGQITAAGATMTHSVVKNYEGTANTSALIWNVNTDPSGYLDYSSFTKGTAATHAIEFGTSSPTTLNLIGMTFSGYSGSDNANDSAIHIKRTGGQVDIYCATSPSVRSDGATIVMHGSSVNVRVEAKDIAGSNVNDARVFLKAANGTGPFPFEVTVTGIVNSGTTATVTHNGHGMATNDKVLIDGASLWQNNGVFQITKTGDNTYTYTLPEAPGSSPTGTIKCTFVALEGLTASGYLTTPRSYPSDQPVIGWVRKSSAQPYYKPAPLTGTVDSETGFLGVAVMISDE